MIVSLAHIALECRRADLDAAAAALRERGIDPVGKIHHPPSDAELRCDYWYYQGVVDALSDLIDVLDAEPSEAVPA